VHGDTVVLGFPGLVDSPGMGTLEHSATNDWIAVANEGLVPILLQAARPEVGVGVSQDTPHQHLHHAGTQEHGQLRLIKTRLMLRGQLRPDRLHRLRHARVSRSQPVFRDPWFSFPRNMDVR
jgi:hypothetical protein